MTYMNYIYKVCYFFPHVYQIILQNISPHHKLYPLLAGSHLEDYSFVLIMQPQLKHFWNPILVFAV